MLLEELMKIAEKFPDDLAVLSDNERVTYSELMELSKKAAHKLSRMDVGKGDS